MIWTWLLRILGINPTTPAVSRPASPLHSFDGSGRVIDITIHHTENADPVAEEMAARFTARALENAGFNYSIEFAFDPVPGSWGSTLEDLTRWATYTGRDWTATDSNLLVTDRNGGGIAGVGGKYAIGPGGNIDEVREWHSSVRDRQDRNTWACLHEIGHNLDARHRDDYLEDDAFAFTESGIRVIQEYLDDD